MNIARRIDRAAHTHFVIHSELMSAGSRQLRCESERGASRVPGAAQEDGEPIGLFVAGGA